MSRRTRTFRSRPSPSRRRAFDPARASPRPRQRHTISATGMAIAARRSIVDHAAGRWKYRLSYLSLRQMSIMMPVARTTAAAITGATIRWAASSRSWRRPTTRLVSRKPATIKATTAAIAADKAACSSIVSLVWNACPRYSILGSTIHPLASSPAGTVWPRRSRLAKIGVTFLSGAGTIAGPVVIAFMAASRWPLGACRHVVHWLEVSEASRTRVPAGESASASNATWAGQLRPPTTRGAASRTIRIGRERRR